MLKLTGVHTKYELDEAGDEGLDYGGGSASQYSFTRKQSMRPVNLHLPFAKTEEEKNNLMDLISRNNAAEGPSKSSFVDKKVLYYSKYI